jgi:hypothetical protein
VDKFKNACLIGSLLFMLGLAGAGTYEFGSKVALGDTDIGNLLYNCDPKPTVMYWDTGTNGIYDQNDAVYLHMTTGTEIRSNDIRLTDVKDNKGTVLYEAGTKVGSGQVDLGQKLEPFSPDPIIAFSNLYPGPEYNFLDPIYIHVIPEGDDEAEAETNDVRLNAIDGLGAGSKVFDFHGDHNKKLTPMTFASIKFFNADGDVDVSGKPIYGDLDPVYIDISLPLTFPSQIGFVSVNDLRLSV